jgi:hypothetical protein
MDTQTSKRWGAAVGALVVAAGSAVIWAPTADAAGDATGNNVVRTCKGTVGGEKVKLKAVLHRSSADNDVDAVDIRATDSSEVGGFKNLEVDLRKIVLRVKDENKKVVARTSSPSSPFSVDLGSAGQEVGRVHTEAKFRANDRQTVLECNFTFTESGGSSNG